MTGNLGEYGLSQESAIHVRAMAGDQTLLDALVGGDTAAERVRLAGGKLTAEYGQIEATGLAHIDSEVHFWTVSGLGVQVNVPEASDSLTLNAATTYTIEVQPTGSFDPAVYVFTDCVDPATSCVGGEDVGMGGGMESLTITPPTTQTYYIGVDSWTGGEIGAFTLTVKQ